MLTRTEAPVARPSQLCYSKVMCAPCRLAVDRKLRRLGERPEPEELEEWRTDPKTDGGDVEDADAVAVSVSADGGVSDGDVPKLEAAADGGSEKVGVSVSADGGVSDGDVPNLEAAADSSSRVADVLASESTDDNINGSEAHIPG